MYFIDLIFKKLLKNIDERQEFEDRTPSFQQEESDDETCEEHVFLPVDSTGEVLACVNCGLVIHKKDLHKQNPF